MENIEKNLNIENWINLFSLADSNIVRGFVSDSSDEIGRKKSLLIMFDGDRLIEARHSQKGAITAGFVWEGAENLEAIAKRENVDSVTAIDISALERIYKNVIAKRDTSGDYIKRLTQIYDSLRIEANKSARFYPHRQLKPAQDRHILQWLKFLIKNNRVFVFYLFERNRIWTSVIVGVKNGQIDILTDHEAISEDGLALTDWRRDYKNILSKIERKFYKPGFGFFGELRSFSKVVRAKRGLHALEEARNKKEIIIEPAPVALRAALKAGRLIGI